MKHRQVLGRRGEDLTATLLTKRGYVILERNYRAPQGEVDLIALDGDTLAFIEVKTRATDAFGSPQMAVSAAKRRRILRGALHYLQHKRNLVAGLRYRCDVAAVRVGESRSKPDVELIKNAFSIDAAELSV